MGLGLTFTTDNVAITTTSQPQSSFIFCGQVSMIKDLLTAGFDIISLEFSVVKIVDKLQWWQHVETRLRACSVYSGGAQSQNISQRAYSGDVEPIVNTKHSTIMPNRNILRATTDNSVTMSTPLKKKRRGEGGR